MVPPLFFDHPTVVDSTQLQKMRCSDSRYNSFLFIGYLTMLSVASNGKDSKGYGTMRPRHIL